MVEWRTVSVSPNYEVSDSGRIRNAKTGLELSLGTGADKYVRIRIPGFVGNLHRLIAEAFLGPCPEGCEIRHWNDDGRDNRLANLTYGTRSQNNLDVKYNRGRTGSRRYLSPAEVRYIRSNPQVRGVDLARDLGCSPQLVCNVRKNKVHKDIPT